MTDTELKNYHAAINDCWHFFKEFASFTGDKNDEVYWYNMIMTADDIAKKYPGEMIQAILSAMIAEIQTKWRAEMAERSAKC